MKPALTRTWEFMFSAFLSEVRRRRVLPTILPYLGLVWLLLQVLSVLQPMLNWSPLVGTFAAIMLFAGFPVVLYLSWYFNISADGLTPIEDPKSGELSRFGLVRWLVLIFITVCSGGLGYTYYEEVKQDFVKGSQGFNQVVNAKSIAVLPFRDQSAEQDQAFLSEGISEELTALLGKYSELNVAASSSSFAFTGRNLSPIEVGIRLNVDTVLTGSLRKIGNKLTVRTELVNILDGMTLWTETFNRNFEDIFAVEREISRSIVNVLEDRFLTSEQVATSTPNSDAYIMYLKGREQYRLQTTEGMKEARKYFEQAIALDPEYAKAYVANADTLLMLEKGSEHFGILETSVALALAEQNLDKALTRDSSLPEGFAIRGRAFQIQGKHEEAIDSFDKALSLNDSLADAYLWKYLSLIEQLKFEEAMTELEKAYVLDPISLPVMHNRAFELTQMGQYDEAQTQYQQIIRDFPDSPLGYAGLADLASTRGELSESLKYWLKASALSPDNAQYEKHVIQILVSVRMIEEAKLRDANNKFENSYLVIEEKEQELIGAMKTNVAAYPDDPWVKFEFGWYLSVLGHKEKGAQLFTEVVPLLNEEDLYVMSMCSPAIEIAWALQFLDRNEESIEYLTGCEKRYQQAIQSGIQDRYIFHLGARIAALKKNNESAIKNMTHALEKGWSEWWTAKDPVLASTTSSDEMVQVFNAISSKLDAERKEAEQVLLSSPE